MAELLVGSSVLSYLFEPFIVNSTGKSCCPAIAAVCFDERRGSITQDMSIGLLIGRERCNASDVLWRSGFRVRRRRDGGNLGSCFWRFKIGSARDLLLTSAGRSLETRIQIGEAGVDKTLTLLQVMTRHKAA